MELLYFTVKNGTKPYINKKGEVVITLEKAGERSEIEYRIVHSYKAKNSEEEKWRVSDKGQVKSDRLHELHITRKAQSKQ